MPLFLSEEEFRALSHDAGAVAERADAVIRDLRRQLETVKAEADAASISSEQTCAILEQRYDALSADLDLLRSENAQLAASSERHASVLAEAQAEKHQLHLKAVSTLCSSAHTYLSYFPPSKIYLFCIYHCLKNSIVFKIS